MLANVMVGVMAEINAIASGARSTNKIAVRGAKRDSLDDARQKVVDKLMANRKYYAGESEVAQDCVYKKQTDGKYAIGVKYGNRYLEGIFDGEKYVENIGEKDVANVIDALAGMTAAGRFDSAIETVMHANVNARSSTRH